MKNNKDIDAEDPLEPIFLEDELSLERLPLYVSYAKPDAPSYSELVALKRLSQERKEQALHRMDDSDFKALDARFDAIPEEKLPPRMSGRRQYRPRKGEGSC